MTYASRSDAEELRYNVRDCIRTARVYAGLLPEFQREGERARKLYEQQIQLSEFCAEMHTNGFLVDEAKRQYMIWFLNERRRQYRKKVKRLVGIKGFEATPNHMRSLIFKRHETKQIARFGLDDPFDPKMWTPTGDKISVKADALLMLMTQTYVPPELMDIIDAYWEVASDSKSISTFLDSRSVLRAIGPDGRMRASWNSCGTDTGRFSCSEPNLMNLPQVLRYMYRASKGCVLVHADASQLELRVMAVVSGDEVLARNLATGDVYTEDAKMIFNLPKHFTKKEVKTSSRQASKIGHLLFQYGGGTRIMFAGFLQEDRKIQYTLVAEVHRKLKDIYKGTVQYWDDEMARVLRDGYSETRVMHRRRSYPLPPERTEVANYPVQGTASDIMNCIALDVRAQVKKHVPSVKLVAQLHDALDGDTPTRHRGVMRRIFEDAFSRQFIINGKPYVFPCEIKEGEHWGDV